MARRAAWELTKICSRDSGLSFPNGVRGPKMPKHRRFHVRQRTSQSCEALPRTRLVSTSRPTEDRPDANLCPLVPAASDQSKLITNSAAGESSYQRSRLLFRARPRSAEWELEVSTLVVVERSTGRSILRENDIKPGIAHIAIRAKRGHRPERER